MTLKVKSVVYSPILKSRIRMIKKKIPSNNLVKSCIGDKNKTENGNSIAKILKKFSINLEYIKDFFVKNKQKGSGKFENVVTSPPVLGVVLPIEEAWNEPNINILNARDLNGENLYYNCSKIFDIDNAKFKDEINPQVLKKRIIPENEKVIFISNFDKIPGTIAATTALDKCIATDKLYQCAALAVVDKSLNKQSLIHVYPWFSVESNKNLIKKVLSDSRQENLELSIVPGCEFFTDATVTFLDNVTKELAPEAKINYCNLPAVKSLNAEATEDFVLFYEGKSAIWLNNGNLFCCNSNEIPNKIVNPKEFLTYFA